MAMIKPQMLKSAPNFEEAFCASANEIIVLVHLLALVHVSQAKTIILTMATNGEYFSWPKTHLSK